MNLFRRLGDLLKPPQPSQTEAAWEIPLGLTAEEWADLKALRGDRGYDAWLKSLDALCIFAGETLLGSGTNEALHFQRGVVTGIRKAAILVDELKKSEDAFLDEQRKRSRPRERAGRVAALFGSPGWNKPKRSS